MLTIYSTPESLYCSKLRILLRHKQAQWQEITPDGGCGSKQYRDMIPSGTMPAMIDGDLVIADSEAIAEYLNEKIPHPAMLPESLTSRAKCRERSRFHDTRLEPEVRVLFPHIGPDQAGSEVSALLGRIPSAVGYQPTLAEEMGQLQERITTTRAGSITSVQAVYVPADDLTDPSPATTFAHLDSTVTLSRAITDLGIYPAVDPLDSTSRQLDPLVVGQEHYDVSQQVLEARPAAFWRLGEMVGSRANAAAHR